MSSSVSVSGLELYTLPAEKATVVLIVCKCAEHCTECVAWGGKLTRLQAQIATQLQALADYLRPLEMQELLRKGDCCGLQKFAAISDKCADVYANGANAARAQVATTARGLLADCQVAV